MTSLYDDDMITQFTIKSKLFNINRSFSSFAHFMKSIVGNQMVPKHLSIVMRYDYKRNAKKCIFCAIEHD